MRKNLQMILALLMLPAVCFGQIQKADQNSQDNTGDFGYRIGPGDSIQINVWEHRDLNMEIRVRPDGMISFPLMDDINASDITPTELKREITARIGKIIRDPQVSVNVVDFQSKKFFVLGEVNQPGVYSYEGEERVLDAITRAMGYKEDSAALRSVMIIKGNAKAKSKIVRVNIYDFIKKGDASQNILLEPGDIVFIPKTFISNVDKFIDQFFTQTDPALKYYLDIYTIRKPGAYQ